MDIGKNIREVRERQGLMVSEVARRADLTISGVTSIETGRVQRPAVQTVVRLARALGVEPGELLREEPATVEKTEAPPAKPQGRFERALERFVDIAREEDLRARLEVVESFVAYAIDRSDYYTQKLQQLEHGPTEDATYNGAYNLVASAVDEFSRFFEWLFDGPARPLWLAIENGVELEIEEAYRMLITELIADVKTTLTILSVNADELAETEAQIEKIDAKNREMATPVEQLKRTTHRTIDRSDGSAV
jgi:transcriptional regulator with XRE-family HTH domain